MASRASLAHCLVGPSLEPIKSLLDTHESMMTLEKAVAQSFALFDEVIRHGDPSEQVLAAYQKGELYEQLLVRMANTVPQTSGGDSANALYQSRKTLLDAMLQPWREQAATAFRETVSLADKSPQLASKNAVVRNAVAQSKERLQRYVATTPPPAPKADGATIPTAGVSAAPTETAPAKPAADDAARKPAPEDTAKKPTPPSAAPAP